MIAWLGSILLAVCGVPELLRTISDGKCHIGWGMLLCWFFGEVLLAYHIIIKVKDRALLFNYSLNIAIITIMLFYKFKEIL